MKRAVVLLSGGLDSTIVLADAINNGRVVVPLCVDYGQRNRQELTAARRVASHFGLSLKRVTMSLDFGGSSSLTNHKLALPGATPDREINSTYVPCRNAILLSLAAAYAESNNCREVWIGLINTGGLPDGRYEFMRAMELAVALGSKSGFEGNPIEFVAPLVSMGKAEAVLYGYKLMAPLHLTWTCFSEQDSPCGICQSCISRAHVFRQIGFKDPALSVKALTAKSR